MVLRMPEGPGSEEEEGGEGGRRRRRQKQGGKEEDDDDDDDDSNDKEEEEETGGGGGGGGEEVKATRGQRKQEGRGIKTGMSMKREDKYSTHKREEDKLGPRHDKTPSSPNDVNNLEIYPPSRLTTSAREASPLLVGVT
eukprot:434433-Hanusia_phi.AAC.4